MWKNKKDMYFYFTNRSVLLFHKKIEAQQMFFLCVVVRAAKLTKVVFWNIGSTFNANAVIFVNNVLHVDTVFVKSQ